MQHWCRLFCFFHFDAVVGRHISGKWLQFLSLTARNTKQTHVTSFVIVLNGTEAPLPKFVLLLLLLFFFKVAQVWTHSLGDASQCLKVLTHGAIYCGLCVQSPALDGLISDRLLNLSGPLGKVSKCPGGTGAAGETGAGSSEVPGLPALVDT